MFTDRASFLSALSGGHLENDFENVSTGASGGLFDGAGTLQYLVYTQFGARSALYNGKGFVSVDRAADKLVVRMIGDAPVTAVGANFWPVSFASRAVNGTVKIELGDGTVESFESTGPGDFRGFITDEPLFSITIDAPEITAPAPGTSPDRWPAMDNLIVGPTP